MKLKQKVALVMALVLLCALICCILFVNGNGRPNFGLPLPFTFKGFGPKPLKVFHHLLEAEEWGTDQELNGTATTELSPVCLRSVRRHHLSLYYYAESDTPSPPSAACTLLVTYHCKCWMEGETWLCTYQVIYWSTRIFSNWISYSTVLDGIVYGTSLCGAAILRKLLYSWFSKQQQTEIQFLL